MDTEQPEYWEDLRRLANFIERPSADADVKNSLKE